MAALLLVSVLSSGDVDPSLPFGHGCATLTQRQLAPIFCNSSLPPEVRVNALVSRMTVGEKVNMTWISGCTSKDPTDGGVARLGTGPITVQESILVDHTFM